MVSLCGAKKKRAAAQESENYRKRIEELEHKNATLESEKEKLRREKENASNENETNILLLAEHVREVEKKDRELSKLNEELEGLKRETPMNNSFGEVQELRHVEESLRDDLGVLKSENETLRQEIEIIKDENQELKDELDQLHVEAGEKELALLRDLEQKFNTKEIALEGDNNELRDEIAKLKESHEITESELNEMYQQLHPIENERDEAKRKLHEADKKTTELTTRIEEMKALVTTQSEQLAQLRSDPEVDDAKKQIFDSQLEQSRLKSELEKSQNRIKELEQQLATVDAQTVDPGQVTLTERGRNDSELRNENIKLKEEVEKSKHNAKIVMANFQDQFLSLQNDKDKLTDQVKKLEEKLKNMAAAKADVPSSCERGGNATDSVSPAVKNRGNGRLYASRNALSNKVVDVSEPNDNEGNSINDGLKDDEINDLKNQTIVSRKTIADLQARYETKIKQQKEKHKNLLKAQQDYHASVLQQEIARRQQLEEDMADRAENFESGNSSSSSSSARNDHSSQPQQDKNMSTRSPLNLSRTVFEHKILSPLKQSYEQEVYFLKEQINVLTEKNEILMGCFNNKAYESIILRNLLARPMGGSPRDDQRRAQEREQRPLLKYPEGSDTPEEDNKEACSVGGGGGHTGLTSQMQSKCTSSKNSKPMRSASSKGSRRFDSAEASVEDPYSAQDDAYSAQDLLHKAQREDGHGEYSSRLNCATDSQPCQDEQKRTVSGNRRLQSLILYKPYSKAKS